mgnify:CR=1 FL=1
MVKIEAIIRPERVNQVVQALEEVGCKGFHFVNVTGQGQQQGVEVFTGRGATTTSRSSLPKTLLVTVVNDDQKDSVVEAIIESARSGNIGDGKIFVSDINAVIRIRTGESGEGAI